MRSHEAKVSAANKDGAKRHHAGDVLTSELDPNCFMDLSRDLVANLHAFTGRGATLRFHGGGPHVGLTVWIGTKNVGYMDAADLGDMLSKAICRAAFHDALPALRAYLGSAQMRLNAGPDGWKVRLSDGEEMSQDRAAEPKVRSARDGWNVVTGGREKKKQCSDQT